jgi:hypothetical protein
MRRRPFLSLAASPRGNGSCLTTIPLFDPKNPSLRPDPAFDTSGAAADPVKSAGLPAGPGDFLPSPAFAGASFGKKYRTRLLIRDGARGRTLSRKAGCFRLYEHSRPAG